MTTEKTWSPPTLVLPRDWAIHTLAEDGVRYISQRLNLALILSCAVEEDGKHWVHFSLSHRDRLPTWHELVKAKDWALGDVNAYQVLPTADKYINIHPTVLHLFHCLDGDPLPDFTRSSGSL